MTKNINFFLSKGLSKDELMAMIIENPFMLTVKDNRLDAMEKLLVDKLKMNPDMIKRLIFLEVTTYNSSPIHFEKNIQYLLGCGYSIDQIREFTFKHPDILRKNNELFVEMFPMP